jgi:hypothetical protein
MGGNQTKMKQTIDKKTLNKSVTNMMKANSQNVSNSASINQTIDIDFTNATLNKCPLMARNQAVSNQSATAELSSEQISDMSTKIQDQLENQIKQSVKQSSDAGLSVNNDNTDIQIRQEVKNVTEKTFSSTNVQNIKNNLFTNQGNGFSFSGTMNCDGEKVEINNDFVNDQVAKGLIEDLQQNIDTNEILSSLVTELDKAVDQENKGVFGAIESLLGMGNMAILASVLCVCIVCSVIAGMALSPAGQRTMNKGANLAVSKANMMGGPSMALKKFRK